MSLVSENMQSFQKGKSGKDVLDVGIERSDNPNNLYDEKTHFTNKSNGEFLEEIIEELSELGQTLHYRLSVIGPTGNIEKGPSPRQKSVLDKLMSAADEIAEASEELAKIKVHSLE